MPHASKLARWAGAALALYAVGRTLAFFLEALEAERQERHGDEELLAVCVDGLAAQSQRMRNTCLQLHQARATPLLLAACLRASHAAYADFAGSLWSPGNLITLLCFVLLSVATPFLRLARALGPTAPLGALCDEEDHATRLVVLDASQINGIEQTNAARFWMQLRRRVGTLDGIDGLDCRSPPRANVTELSDGWREVSFSGAPRLKGD